VIGITSRSAVVSRTRRRLNGRLHWLQSVVVSRHHKLQMVPNAPSHHSPAVASVIEPWIQPDTFGMACRAPGTTAYSQRGRKP
jgi:hypothetical protein